MRKGKDIFQEGLQRHLWKCELEYRAKWLPGGSCVDWLAPMCESTEEIARFLREIGFRIREITELEDPDGSVCQWVETTNGILVYVNAGVVQGLVAQSASYRTRKGGDGYV